MANNVFLVQAFLTSGDLPATGFADGEIAEVLTPKSLYTWDQPSLTWQLYATGGGGGGTVTSVGLTFPTTSVFNVTGSPVTGAGSLDITFTDPAAHRLIGWDNTDNDVVYFTIGSGLSYDHATHTLSSTGSGTVTNIATAGLISGGPITTTGTITTSIATNRLVGRATAGTGIFEAITLGTGLSFTGTTLNASVTAPGGSTTQIQYNNAGAFGGIPNVTYNGTNFDTYDSIFRILDNVDPTKIANFQCSGIGTGNTRTFTFVNQSGTLAIYPIALTVDVSGVLPVANGGTGLSAISLGQIIYGSGVNLYSPLSSVSIGSYLRSGGVATAPAWSTCKLPDTCAIGDMMYASGTNQYANLADIATGNVLLSGGVTTAPSYGKVGLTTHVTGILPLANGGTNANLTASNGGIFYSTATAGAILAGTATAGLALISGASTLPSWYVPTAGSVLFAGIAGKLEQDNANFFWDDTNNRLAIGTTTPASRFDVTTNALGVTQTNTTGILIANNTAAAAGAQQISPALRFRGSGWKTNATAASQTVDFQEYIVPVQNAAAPTGRWVVAASINGAAYNERFGVGTEGAIYLSGTSVGTSGQVLTSQGAGAAAIWTSAAGTITSANLSLTPTGMDVVINESHTNFWQVYQSYRRTSHAASTLEDLWVDDAQCAFAMSLAGSSTDYPIKTWPTLCYYTMNGILENTTTGPQPMWVNT